MSLLGSLRPIDAISCDSLHNRKTFFFGTVARADDFMPGLGARGAEAAEVFMPGLGALGAMLFRVLAGVEVPRVAVRERTGLAEAELLSTWAPLAGPGAFRGASRGSLQRRATSRTRPGRTSPLFLSLNFT